MADVVGLWYRKACLPQMEVFGKPSFVISPFGLATVFGKSSFVLSPFGLVVMFVR